MQIYLPIAEMSVNVLLLLGLGGAVGFLSGMFGVGGGFLMTPMLIFAGIPPAVAVATGVNQIVGSSVSGVLSHWRRNAVDLKMGTVLVIGGAAGSTLGAWIFERLHAQGQIDVLVSLAYVVFLGAIGTLMLVESVRALRSQLAAQPVRRKRNRHLWVHGLPFKMRFRRSGLYVSALLPVAIGFAVGILTAIMGVGGGFIMVPAMIYLIGMPTAVVVGTSLFQIIFVTAIVTILYAINVQAVDVMLALILLVGGVIGAQIGARAATRLASEQLRILLALLVLGVGGRLAWGVLVEPADLYSLAPALAE